MGMSPSVTSASLPNQARTRTALIGHRIAQPAGGAPIPIEGHGHAGRFRAQPSNQRRADRRPMRSTGARRAHQSASAIQALSISTSSTENPYITRGMFLNYCSRYRCALISPARATITPSR